MSRSAGAHFSAGRAAVDDRYDPAAIVLHWATFALVLVVGTLGLLRDAWPNRQAQTFWINIHALLGLLLWVVVMIRLGWRMRRSLPAFRTGPHRREGVIARLVHLVLYALLLITPILGIITFVYHGRTFDFGIFQVDPSISSNKAVFHPTQNIHGYLAYSIFALAAFHALAALWHHFFLRDGILRRMWPARSLRECAS